MISICQDLPTAKQPNLGKVLVTGASGYIGGRLVPELLERGYDVRAMVRGNREAYSERWPDAEIIEADALDPESLHKALRDVHTVFFLIHSLLLGKSKFEAADIQAAISIRDVASFEGVKRIIYLGGIGDSKTSNSRHLRSRMQVAAELSKGSVPVTILRAATIIGAGSASYEIIRHLVARLRVSPIPHWAKNGCQPIGVTDVIKYLVGSMEAPETIGNSFDIGGRDLLTYERMLKIFAQTLNKNVAFIPTPFSNIGFYSYIASLMTPVPAPITASLMEGLKDEVICRDDDIQKYIPIEPLTYKEAIVLAMNREEQDRVATRWTDAYPPAHQLAIKLNELTEAPTFSAKYSIVSNKSPNSIFKSVCKIGGNTGWFNNNWMWWARGGVDRIFYGVGSARGRRSGKKLRINDVIDFWRVEDIKNKRRLLLRAEMLLPGKAWLEFNIEGDTGNSTLSISPYFSTNTTWGKSYWYIFLPFHHFIFNDLISQIERRSH